jgi:hypothetical protein
MKKIVTGLGACALICALSNPVVAHDPPDYLGIVWQWPPDKLPVRDGNLDEWEVIPEEFWHTHETNNVNSCLGDNSKAVLDPADLSFRWVMTYTEGSSRTHWAVERFDNDWNLGDDMEPTIDADHSGGTFWTIEGMSDEESARQKGRHAQIYHIWFDDGLRQGGDSWLWFWMTSADWYEGLPWSDAAYKYTGTPDSGEEMHETSEFMLPTWDDFNWADPEGGIEHLFEEGEIIGLNMNMWDHETEADPDNPVEGVGRWTISPNCENFGDADFLADYLLLEVDEEIMSTAVEEDSWGNVKASFAQ